MDLLFLRPDGSLVRRESYFDSAPLALALSRRPRAWWPWFRSGLWPLAGRRPLLDRLRGRTARAHGHADSFGARPRPIP